MIVIQDHNDELERLIYNTVRKAFTDFNSTVKNTTNSPADKDEHLTVDQAAKFLNLKKSTIYTMVSRGELSSLKRSKRIYFLRQDLINYLKGGRRKSNSEIVAEAKTYSHNRRTGAR